MDNSSGSQRKTSRQRAVVLTPDALKRLQERLAEASAREGDGRALTRSRRAQLLGVSVVTADRILAGRGVDRATLRVAFEQMGLAWDDSYCLPARPEGSSKAGSREAEPAPPARVVVTPRPLRHYALGAAVLLLLLTTPFLYRALKQALTRPVSNPSAPAIPAVDPGDRWKPEYARLHLLGADEYHRGDYQNARKHVEAAIALARQHNAVAQAAGALKIEGDLESERGDFAKASACYKDSLALWGVIRYRQCQAPVLEALGELERQTGDYRAARRHLEEALAIFREGKVTTGVAMVCRDLGSLAARQRDPKGAERWFQRSLTTAAPLPNGKPIVMDVQGRRAHLLRDLGRYDQARSLLKRCLAFWTQQKHPRWIAVCERQMGEVECLSGNTNAGRALLERSMEAFERLGDRAGAAACRSSLQRAGRR